MIKSIQISNFQSHKDTQLEFSPGVNAIVGASDSGKTSIIRALRWLAWNRPLGDAYRSTWGGDTIIDVDTGEGKIQRIKTNKDNMYVMNSHKEFKAAGTDVPEEIKTLLNLNEINLQQQLDRSFLLDDSPGAVAEHFNEVAHLDIIDYANSTIQKWIRQIDQDIRSEEKQVDELEVSFSQFEYLNTLEKAVENIEQDTHALWGWENRNAILFKILNSIAKIDQDVLEYHELIKTEGPVNSILSLFDEEKEIVHKANELQELLNDISVTEDSISQHVQLSSMEKPLSTVLQLKEAQKEVLHNIRDLKRIVDEIETTTAQIETKQEQTRQLETQFKKEMPNICPLCGRKVK